MTRFQQLGKTLLLSALVLGLNVLALLSMTHSRHPNHARGSVAHGHHHSLRRWTPDGGDDDEQSLQTDTRDVHISKQHRVALPLSHLTALTSRALSMPPQEFAELPLRAESLLAPGSTPRAPGAPRAPPAI